MSNKYYEQIVNNERRNARAIAKVKELIQNGSGSGVIFVLRLTHLEVLHRLLTDEGIIAEVVHGGTSIADRNRIKSGLASGTTKVAVATVAWTTGVNIPSLEWIIWAGAGVCPIWIVQGAGRAMRKFGGKEYTIYDFSDVDLGGCYAQQGAKREENWISHGFNVEKHNNCNNTATATTWDSNCYNASRNSNAKYGQQSVASIDRNACFGGAYPELSINSKLWISRIISTVIICILLIYTIVAFSVVTP